MSNLKINLDTNNVEGGCAMPDNARKGEIYTSKGELFIRLDKDFYINPKFFSDKMLHNMQ